jgi:hypothetical protein
MNKAEAKAITGGLSNPSKMPGLSFNLPAKECPIGSVLRTVEGSTCAGCYALKGRYNFPNVQDALYRRLEALKHPQWIAAMVTLIAGQDYFRWHDSGDILGLWHLLQIAKVCELTPEVKHWLPTREVKTVRQFAKLHKIPSNLTIRISATMVDSRAQIVKFDNKYLPTSTVHTGDGIGLTCPAPDQDNQCKDCRACWHHPGNISYRKH